MTKGKWSKLLVVLATAGIIGLSAGFLFVAGAATVTYTVSGWGPNQYPAPTTPPPNAPWGTDGYPGDTLRMTSYTGTLDLAPGTYILKINTFNWDIDYTYGGTETAWDYPDHWHDVVHDITAVRSISFAGGASGTLRQGMTLENTWFNDYVTIDEGGTSTFIVGGYMVEVTPIGVSRFGGSNFHGGNPWAQPDVDLYARFVVTKWDTEGPVITIDVPADMGEYDLNSTVYADWTATDAKTGIADATGTVPAGGTIDTRTVGLHTFTVTATDRAGNTTTATVTYRVVYSVNPGGAAGGGGAEGEPAAGFLEGAVAGGGGGIDVSFLAAVYRVGDPIHVSFGLSDAAGAVIPDAVASLTLVAVASAGEEESYTVLGLWPLAYDDESDLYYFDLETGGLSPGIYDLWLGFDDGTQIRLRIQLLPAEGG